MTDKASQHSGGWMVEVAGDGLIGRHKRYLVSAASREAASSAVQEFLGGKADIKDITPIPATAFEATKIQPGKVVPL